MTTTTITVSTTSQLYDALAHATGGETIKLATGDYGSLNLSNLTFPSNVTIMSERPLHPATFTGMDLTNVSNLTVGGVIFDYQFKSTDPGNVSPFRVSGGANVTIRNSTFDGALASGIAADTDGYGYGIGLSVSGTTGLRVAGNEFYNFLRGVVVSNAKNTTIANNDIHDIRSDGMDFAQVQGVNILGNHIHDFRTSPTSSDHPDMIQFWTAGTTAPSTDILIKGNILDEGTGTWTQTILMGNELVGQGLAGTEMFYRNVTITDNVITNGHLHGITVNQAAGVTVTNNTVLHTDGDNPDGFDGAVEIPQINISSDSTGVTISKNVTAGVNGYSGQADWVVSQNVLVQDQDPNGANYYGDIFITSSLTAHDGVHTFLALPGSLIDTLGAGAAVTRDYLPEPGGVAALFEATRDIGGSVQTRHFDAGLSLTDLGTLPTGTTFKWTFGDGTSATGEKVEHSFANGGHYDVTLTVTLPTGVSSSVTGTIGIEDRDLVTLGADGSLLVSQYEDTIALPGGTSAGLQLGASGVTAAISGGYISELTRVTDFDILMKIKADATTNSGEIFRLHGGVVASVDSAGKLVVQAFDDALHIVQLTSGAIAVNDLKTHAIDVRLHDGSLQLWVDGKMTASSAFTGTLNYFDGTDFNFGNPWGGANFHGDLTAFEVKIGENALEQSKSLLAMASDGTFPGGTTTVTGAPASSTGLHLGDGVAAKVGMAPLAGMLSATDFNIALEVTSDTQDTTGNIFHLDGSIRGRVNSAGAFSVFATDTSGKTVRVTTTGLDLTDMKAHDLDVRLDNGMLQVWVDGTMAAEKAFAGTLHAPSGTNLVFGQPTSSGLANFHGDMTAFDVSIAADNGWAV